MRNGSLALIFIAALGAGVLHGCGGSSGPKPTPHCLLNSDCHGANDAGTTLVCALGFCVSPCNDSSDCAAGQLCVRSDNGNACRAPEAAAKCAQPSDCQKFCPAMSMDGGEAPVCPLTCGRDLTCRDQCSTDIDCPGQGTTNPQKCTASHVCIDPKVDVLIYDPATNDFNTSVGAGGMSGGAAGTDGAAGATGTAGSAAGATGTAGAGTAGAGTAGAGPDGGAGTAGTDTDGGTMNPDAAEVVDLTAVTPSPSVHQGQSGVTITITKAAGGLSNASVVSLGMIDKTKATVQSTSTDTSLVIRVNVPHGAALGKQTLVVSTKGGTVTAPDVIEVTAITAGPAGSDSNAGSALSPCRSVKQAMILADSGDTIHLMDGLYSAATLAMGGSEETWGYTVPNNVTIVGDSVAGTILDGAGGSSSADGLDSPAMLSVSNLTLKHFRYGVYVNVASTTLTMQHVAISSTSSNALYIDTPAIGSTVTLSGADSIIDEPSTVAGIYVNGNQTSSNAKITINVTDATVQSGYYAVYLYYTSGTAFNMTGGTLKAINTYSVVTAAQTNNVIGNTISLKNTAVIGTFDMNDKTATLTLMGGSITQKSGSVLNFNTGTSVTMTGTTITMNDTSNALNLAAPNGAMTLTSVTLTGGGAGINQTGAGSTAKLRSTEILSPQYYAYYMSAGSLDLGTATEAGMNGLGLPINPSYSTLTVANATGSAVTSNGTSYGDHLDAQSHIIPGATPAAGVIMGPAVRAPQIYNISAGSQVTFF
jgi:hypothetical protein